MITAALDAGVPAGWAAADEAYGNSTAFRAQLRGHQLGYVLAVSRSHLVPIDGGKTASAPTGSPLTCPSRRGSAGQPATAADVLDGGTRPFRCVAGILGAGYGNKGEEHAPRGDQYRDQ